MDIPTSVFSPGGFLVGYSSGGVTVADVGLVTGCAVCFEMPGNPADGGDFILSINASGINGAPGNGALTASDEGTLGYFYSLNGTLTLYGQVGQYDLTPEPPPGLLVGSGIALLGFVFYRRSMPGLRVT